MCVCVCVCVCVCARELINAEREALAFFAPPLPFLPPPPRPFPLTARLSY